MFERILVPLDGSDLSEQVLPAVRELMEGAAVEVTLFTASDAPEPTPLRLRRAGLPRDSAVVTDPGGSAVPDVLAAVPPAYAETKGQAVERRERELLEYLEQAARSLRGTAGRVETAVRFGEPAKEIIELARKGKFGLIVMATHGRSGLLETLQGSVTTEVIRSGVTPVLVVRPASKKRRRKR